jgi:hypothetical protein
MFVTRSVNNIIAFLSINWGCIYRDIGISLLSLIIISFVRTQIFLLGENPALFMGNSWLLIKRRKFIVIGMEAGMLKAYETLWF